MNDFQILKDMRKLVKDKFRLSKLNKSNDSLIGPADL